MDDNLPWFFQMWRYSGSLVHFSLLTLAGMGLWTFLEFAAKAASYGFAVWQTRRFVKTCASLFEQGNWVQVLAPAETRKQSHVADVVARGLRTYRGVHAVLSLQKSAEVAEHQARVAANRLHEQMLEGLDSLGSIATTASLVVLFGTLVGILDSFVGRVWSVAPIYRSSVLG